VGCPQTPLGCVHGGGLIAHHHHQGRDKHLRKNCTLCLAETQMGGQSPNCGARLVLDPPWPLSSSRQTGTRTTAQRSRLQAEEGPDGLAQFSLIIPPWGVGVTKEDAQPQAVNWVHVLCICRVHPTSSRMWNQNGHMVLRCCLFLA
jgi:hypothetical protein